MNFKRRRKSRFESKAKTTKRAKEGTLKQIKNYFRESLKMYKNYYIENSKHQHGYYGETADEKFEWINPFNEILFETKKKKKKS